MHYIRIDWQQKIQRKIMKNKKVNKMDLTNIDIIRLLLWWKNTIIIPL